MSHEMRLLKAITVGTVDDIEALIAQGADPRKLPSHGLLQAIGRSPVGPYEIAPGRTVMAPNSRYRLEVLKCLLEHGADPNAIPLAEGTQFSHGTYNTNLSARLRTRGATVRAGWYSLAARIFGPDHIDRNV